jgi:glycine reductase complex component B subunit gamma
VAEAVGANRVVAGTGVMHPVGDPTRPPEQELEWRRRLIDTALTALSTPVERYTLFRADEG